MKKRVRTCGKVCHSAKGTRCKCICGSFYHGANGTGAANRTVLAQSLRPEELLEQHGLKEGESKFVWQMELPVEVIVPQGAV